MSLLLSLCFPYMPCIFLCNSVHFVAYDVLENCSLRSARLLFLKVLCKLSAMVLLILLLVVVVVIVVFILKICLYFPSTVRSSFGCKCEMDF